MTEKGIQQLSLLLPEDCEFNWLTEDFIYPTTIKKRQEMEGK